MIAEKMHTSMISDLRRSGDKLLKAKLKKGAKKDADKNACETMLSQLAPLGDLFVDSTGDAWMSSEAMRKVVIIGNVSLGMVFDKLNGIDQRAFVKYLLMLQALALVSQGIEGAEASELDGNSSELELTLNTFKEVQADPEAAEVSLRKGLAAAPGDALLSVLLRLAEAYKTLSDLAGLENLFAGTKIGDLAKEISSEIDLSGIDTTKPEAFFDLNNLMGSNSPLPNIIGQVSSKIQGKLASGELSQADLFGEAMNLMKTIDLGKMSSMCPPGAAGAGPGGGLNDIFGLMTSMMKNA